jgi:flavin-dependent dehydrogenase
MPKSSFDVIVLGAGPAGLGSALNLAAKGLSVLVLEKQKLALTSKTWLTFDHVLKKYDLQECIRNRFDEVVFSCYLGSNFSFKKKNFISPIYEEKALALLAQRATQQGAVIKDNEPFINFTIDNKSDHITIRTVQNSYQARLAVDAMGRNSEMLKSQGYNNDVLDMGCLAFFLNKVNHKNQNQLLLYDSYIPGSDYFWLVPLEEDRMMAGLFCFSAINGSNLAQKTERLNFYLKARNIGGRIYDMRWGNIPLGGQRRIHADHILCIGDCCNTPLPSSGFSFNRCLEDSEILADFMVRALKKETPISDYKKEILAAKTPSIEIHLILSDMLSKFTNPMLNKAIGKMNNLDEDFIISFLSGSDMSISFAASALTAIMSTFSLSEIRSLSLKQNHLKNLINLYNLLPALSSAKIGEQLIDFAGGMMKSDYLGIGSKRKKQRLKNKEGS